jgi:Zn-dependent protease with chaperone function
MSDSEPTSADGAQCAATIAGAPAEAKAIYYDGASSRKRSVTLRFSSGLELIEQGIVLDTWPYDAIRRADGRPGLLRLSCIGARPLARLEIADPAAQGEVLARCHSLDLGRSTHRQTWRIVAWSLAAAASIVLLALFGIPIIAERLAPFVPAAIEARIGQAFEQQARIMFGKACTGVEGQAAFTSLVEKVRRAGGVERGLDAQVLLSEMPNAFAAPGGKVYVLNGLIEKARNPDEVAGVLAHELGHVHNNHNMRKIIQAGGTSFLIGLLFGDMTGGGAIIFAGQALLNASYSRDAEREADEFAIETMRKLGRSAKPMGEFLVRLAGREPGKTSIFSSHPLSKERLDRMSADITSDSGAEILSGAEWTALKDICGKERRATQASRP